MHASLAQALRLLDIGEISLYNDKRDKIRVVSPKEHALALFTYLDLAGYLSPDLMEKAVLYLSAAKPFSGPNEAVIAHLKEIYQTAHRGAEFNIDYFFDNFCNTPYFQVDDIIDLIVFLQQTAFDRQFGVERDRLQAKPWLEVNKDLFENLTTAMGIVTPLPPAHDTYCGTGIMGAASSRVKTRIQYFNSIAIESGEAWALSGNRELSKGLDEEALMVDLALSLTGSTPVFVDKGDGAARRSFLDGVTETMMVNYLLQSMCPGKKIAVVDSSVEEGHWRATTSQGAKDIAAILVKRIQEGKVARDKEGTFRFMIIVEQPYTGRMARQVQRAFLAELEKRGLVSTVNIVVEGVGSGVPEKDLNNIAVLTKMNSELGSLMWERFNDARLQLQRSGSLTFRDPKILMFMDRDATYRGLIASIDPELAKPAP